MGTGVFLLQAWKAASREADAGWALWRDSIGRIPSDDERVLFAECKLRSGVAHRLLNSAIDELRNEASRLRHASPIERFAVDGHASLLHSGDRDDAQT